MRAQPIQRDAAQVQHQRDAADAIAAAAAYLDPSDKALLEGIYDRGMTPTALARAAGVKPAAIRARVQRLIQRINSPAFRYVLQHRANWPRQRRMIADAVFLRGWGQRSAAADAQVSVHRVRQEIDRIRTVVEYVNV